MAREPRPLELPEDSGGRRTVEAQGPTGPAARRENVFDGEDRYDKSDPTATRRVGSTTDNADVVAENDGLKS